MFLILQLLLSGLANVQENLSQFVRRQIFLGFISLFICVLILGVLSMLNAALIVYLTTLVGVIAALLYGSLLLAVEALLVLLLRFCVSASSKR